MDSIFLYAYIYYRNDDQEKETLSRGLHIYSMQEDLPFSRELVKNYVQIHASDRARAKLFEDAKNLIGYESYNYCPFELIDEHYLYQYSIMKHFYVDWSLAETGQLNTEDYNLGYRQNVVQWPVSNMGPLFFPTSNNSCLLSNIVFPRRYST